MHRMPIFLALLVSLSLAPQALGKGSTFTEVSITGPTDFGSVNPGQSASLGYQMTSNYPYISVPTLPAGAPFQVVSTDCTGNLAACSATVAFEPTVGGDYTAILTAHSSSAESSLILTGHAYGPSYSWVTPTYLTEPTGHKGKIQLVLHSTGDTPLVVEQFSFDAPLGGLKLGSTSCIGQAIAPGSSCTVEIKWKTKETDPGVWFQGFLSVAQSNSGTTGYASLYLEVTP